jgi:hypothetical protein
MVPHLYLSKQCTTLKQTPTQLHRARAPMFSVAGGCSPPHFDEGNYSPQPYRPSAHEFFAASPKAESIVVEPKDKERTLDR